MHRSAAFTELLRPVAPGAMAIPRDRDRFAPIHQTIKLCGVILLAGLLAACPQPGGKTLAKSGAAKATDTASDGTASDGAASDDTVSDGAAGKDAAQAKATTVMWQNAERLMGLESTAVQAALGAPARIRDEETARIYQYVGSDCVLDLVLYETAGTYRVTYAEARTVKAEHKAVDSCLRSLPAPIMADNGQPST